MRKMWDEISQAVSQFFADLKEFFFDIFIAILDAVLGGISTVVESIPMPEAIMDYNLSDYLHTDILYFLSMSGFDNCLAMFGAAYMFRILRRILTLGIW